MPKTFVITICLASSGSPASNPRGWPTPALAKTTSIRPYSSSARWASASTSRVLGDVALDRDPARLLGQLLQLVLRARAEHDAVPGLRRLAGRGGPDPARSARDHHDFVHGSYRYPAKCWLIAHVSKSKPDAAVTARCRSGASPACPRAARTAVTAAAAATCCCAATTPCATCSPSGAAGATRPSAAGTAWASSCTAPTATGSSSPCRPAPPWSAGTGARSTSCAPARK